MEQPSLFSDLELRQIRHSSFNTPYLEISRQSLEAWKQRVGQYQQLIIQDSGPAQAVLFDWGSTALESQSLNPFALPLQNIEFWRWPVHGPGLAALYFVIDPDQSLLLYIGETCKANQRWKGVHDCKRYVRNYIAAHRLHNLPVSVGIGFWPHAPTDTRPRQRLERLLIDKWRSPFNKENWKQWDTPFVGKP